MRVPFASEKRCISNLFQMKWEDEGRCPPAILSEVIVEPAHLKRRPWFNCDFVLHFVDWRATKSKRSASVCSVLPNALGAELFLVVEKATLTPTALELSGGAAFPITHFASYIQSVEESIERALRQLDHQQTQHPWKQMAKRIPIAKAAFARLLVVGGDVTFLYFPGKITPSMRGQCLNLTRGDECEINCYLDDDDVVCFDGWIRAEVAEGERVLVSLPEQES